MFTQLSLERFKNFRSAKLSLGPLTLILGTNASGKSNLRDAFRLLHGIARGYTLAEIFGDKYLGGSPVWLGIRGGTKEVTYRGEATFVLTAELDVDTTSYTYAVEVSPGAAGKPPRLVRESLSRRGQIIFESTPGEESVMVARMPVGGQHVQWRYDASNAVLPIFAQDDKNRGVEAFTAAKECVDNLLAMRFLDLAPDAMRLPSVPGQEHLGDRGENLSSVLQAICADEQRKRTILEWIKELTPLDVTDFQFVEDATGKILVTLVEQGGHRTSAYSASDGTLRFLAMIAALLGPKAGRFYFFEELENGIHPTRLNLLLQLIEQKVGAGKIQVVATTHSPQLLSFVSDLTLQSTSLVYRLEGRPDAQIRRILDIPDAARLLKQQNASRLHAAGWFENALEFTEPQAQRQPDTESAE